MDKVYEDYYYKIYNWAIKKTNNKEDAEDLTNSVFLAIFQYFSRNIEIKKIENLIWKIAYNLWCTKAKNYVKEKNNINYDEDYELGYEDLMLDKIIYKEILNNLTSIGLSNKEKKIFKMYYIGDLSIKKIANKMNSKEGNIKYFLYSARNKIKDRYYK